MNSDTPLDRALFQLSPRRSHCELFVSGDGKIEKLASGLLKPFVTHLKVAEDQIAQSVQSIKLEVEKHKNAGTWFNKGTLERFVRFVSTPEVLELVSTFDVEMSQLEGARKIYSQGAGDQLSGGSGESASTSTASADITKKELLRAIDVRLVAVKQDLTMACARASAAGFTLDNVSELLLFADHFGAHRLNKACSKFISLCQRRPELISQQHPRQPTWKGPHCLDDRNVRSSSGSDMSIDDSDEPAAPAPVTFTTSSVPTPRLSSSSSSGGGGGNISQLRAPPQQQRQQRQERARSAEPVTCQQAKPSALSSSSAVQKPVGEEEQSAPSAQPAGGSRRLSVQERISLFESKQKEQSTSGVNSNFAAGVSNKAGGKAELRRLSSDVSISVERSVLRRWSGASDMSIDLSTGSSGNHKREAESVVATPSSSSNPQAQVGSKSEDGDMAGSRPQSGSKEDPPPASLSSSSQALNQFRAFSQGKDQTEGVRVRDQASSASQALSNLEKDQAVFSTHMGASSSRVEDVGLGHHTASQTHLKVPLGVAENSDSKDPSASHTPSKSLSGVAEHAGLKDQAGSWTYFRAVSGAAEQVGLREQETSQTQKSNVFPNRPSHVRSREIEATDPPQASSVVPFPSRVGDTWTKDQPVSLTQFKTSANKAEDIVSDKKGSSDYQIQFKAIPSTAVTGAKNKPIDSQSHWKTFPDRAEESMKSESATQAQFGDFRRKLDEDEDSGFKDSDHQGMKLHRQTSAPAQIRKFQGRRGERTPPQGTSLPAYSGRKTKEAANACDPVSTLKPEPAQMTRSSKGNQELNDELQMKADELEKLFAEHQIRVHGDQATSSRRGKPADLLADQAPNTLERRPVKVLPESLPERSLVGESLRNGVEFDAGMLMKMVDNQHFHSISKQQLGDCSPLEDSRGEFYERYTQKRDAKLREEWSSKRAQKEAEMKAMQDSLERSRAEMKAKFVGSVDRQDSALHARRRAEKLRSLSLHSATKNKEQQVESVQNEEEEDPYESSEQTQYGQDISFNEANIGDNSSRNGNTKKILHNRSGSSSTPRTSTVPVPRQSARPANPGSGRRRTLPENLLAQSVPNFSDLRKENTKPSTGISKMTTHSHSRNYSRSKSTSEDINLVKEEKPRRSQSMRKSSASPGELKDLSSINSDSVTLTPLRLTKEQTEQGSFNKTQKNGDSKPFLRKGNGIGPGSGAGIAKLKASVASENPKNGEESEFVDQPEDSPDMVKDMEEEFERMSAEEGPRAVDFPADSDNEKPRLSQESGNSGDPGSENGEVLRSFSQMDDDSAEVLAGMSSKFNTSVGTVQESPGESPGSWNSHIHHSFTYAHETSDVDALAESPIGSPASWNSHPLNQMMEADAARMRKKWGSAQKPILIANPTQQPRKDVTKGFKRLLKFGRKSRGAESLVTDWVSASTTSEGDDDTEDGRDIANRSSDDLRKTRMGFSQYHAAYDGFNEGEIFHEQVQSLRTSIPAAPANFKLREDHLSGSSLKAPRSFFSLSSFRGKGSESKLR